MRVALIKHSAVGRHGGTRLFFRLAHELRALGHDVDLLVHDLDEAAAFPEMTAGLEIRAHRRIRFAGRRPLPLLLAEQERHSRELAQLVPADVDVLNVHEWRGVRAGALAKRGRPLVWNCNDPSPWDLLATRRDPLRRAVGRVLGAIDRAYGVAAVDRTVVLDERVRWIMRTSTGMDPAIVRCGADLPPVGPDKAAARRALGLGDAFVVLAVGVVVPHRRFEDVIAALASLPARIEAVIVGSDQLDGGHARRLRALAADRGVADRIRFVTRPPADDELRSYYAAADAFVFPNEEQTWGIVVTEAMAAGLPCVVSTGAGVHEVLTDGSNALLVPPRAPRALAGAIDRLASDGELRERMGKRSAAWVAEHLTWKAFASGMVAQYREAAQRAATDVLAKNRANV